VGGGYDSFFIIPFPFFISFSCFYLFVLCYSLPSLLDYILFLREGKGEFVIDRWME